MGKKKGGAEGGKPKFSVLDLGKKAEGEEKKPKGPTKKEKRLAKQKLEEAKRNAKDDYLGGLMLPPSDSEEEYEDEETEYVEKEISAEEKRRMKKLEEKNELRRKRKEESLLAVSAESRKAAMRADDNAFDVSFENPQMSEEVMSSTKDIKVHNMTIRAKGKALLENTALTIVAGRKYGLVGPNGKGKSTLLRLLARRQLPVPDGIDVLLVEQEVVGDEKSALESVVMADVELMSLRDEESELTAKMNQLAVKDAKDDTDEDAKIQSRLTEIYDRMSAIGASAAEARASKILHGLGFTKKMQGRATNTFSGGWRMRISLARALFIQPTLLMLDEPTNHLDLRAAIWLEEYLMRWKKTLIVVSHDRDFLDSVTTDIIHLHDERLHQYRGNFSTFEDMYEQRRREANKAYEKYEKQMKAAKASGSRNKQDKVKQNQKQRNKHKNKGGDESLGDTDGAPRKWNDYTVQFDFPETTDLSPPLIQLIDADFAYKGRDDFGMSNLNLGVDMGSRIAVVGPNGSGKSTLMNLLAGDLEPTSGDSRRNQKLRIGRYAQHFVDILALDVTPVQYLMEKFPTSGLKMEQMRAKLGKFGLSGHHHLQPIVKLSGGQKARVVFAAVSLSRPHILLLDEPTNHLDMQSIDALADAIEEFEGGVVIISHDSRLLSRICEDEERSEVWIVEDGEVSPYDGDFEDYRDELVKEIARELDEE
mmetsp:Transcript_15569/g.39674  ORF Transcript_15569/g.39674 Transcript_15569/m.39674 type:complete len:705 (-) Transcript_15569:41-2155(-)